MALDAGTNIIGALSANQSVNTAQINGVTPLMGNGVTGTGSQRVTIASDNTAFAVNSTLSAETTKVIGVVRNADGAGNLLTSNSTTTSSKFGLDSNILSILGTAPTTAGKLDIKGADGDVFVRNATAANFLATVSIAAAQTLATVTTVTTVSAARIVGNAGAILDGATGTSVPANVVYDGARGTTALPTAVSDGQLVGDMADKFGRQVVLPQAPRDLISSQTTTISSSTSETTIVTQGAAGVFNDLISINIVNTSATPVRIDLRDATSGSIIGQFFAPATDMRGIAYPVPLPQTTAANNWTAQCSASVADVRIHVQFVKNK